MKVLRNPLLSALLLLSLTSACARFAKPFMPTDRGGLYLVIEVKADQAQLDQSIQQTMAVMQNRCDQLGVYCKLERLSGDKVNQFMLRISSPEDPARIKGILLSEGLEIRAVVTPTSSSLQPFYSTQAEAAAATAGTDRDVLPYLEDHTERFVVVEHKPIITGQGIRSAKATSRTGRHDDNQISFDLNPGGAEKLGKWTSANINNYLAVVLNKEVRSVAIVKGQITDAGEISGRFTKQQAGDIAMVLMSGNLPAPIQPLEEGTYKP